MSLPTLLLGTPRPPFKLDSTGREAKRPQGKAALRPLRLTSVWAGKLPGLACKGRGKGKWVGLGREKSQPFELPRQHPL